MFSEGHTLPAPPRPVNARRCELSVDGDSEKKVAVPILSLPLAKGLDRRIGCPTQADFA